jgi:hypothetical protein
MFHNVMKIYNMLKNTPPETRDALMNALKRAEEVAAKADKAADAAAADKAANKVAEEAAQRAQNATADSLIRNPPKDDGDFFERWKHTPIGGSRKRSINCRRPRGFSQRQHCKYGRRGWTRRRRGGNPNPRDIKLKCF